MPRRLGARSLLLGAVLALSLLMAPVAQAGWLPPVDLSEAAEQTGAPHVVLDAQGNATAVWSTWNGEDTVVEADYRPAGQSWQPPVDISEASGETTLLAGEHNAQYPRIAVDASGNVTVVWERYEGVNDMVVQAAYRPAGGSWQAPVDVSQGGGVGDEAWVADDAAGDVTAVWMQHGSLLSAYRPAGGSWEAPVDVSGSGAEALTPQAAVDAEGDATAVWMTHDGPKLVVKTAYRPAGGVWGAPAGLTADGEEGDDPQIALDAHGDAIVVWGHGDIRRVRGSYRPAGGDWQTPADISSEGEDAQSLRVALDGQGDAVVTWAGSTNAPGGHDRAQAAYRPAGGSWGKPTDLSEDGGNAFPQDVAFDQEGNAVIVWVRSDGSNGIVQAAYRPAGKEWQEPVSLSEEGKASSNAAVVLDAEGEAVAAKGDATVVWTSSEGEHCEKSCGGSKGSTVQAAGYDTNGPPAKELDAPATSTVGTPVTFSASALDVWSPKLEFGDGSSTDGTSATHTYTRPGNYTVTFAGTDVLGYRGSTQRTIAIGPVTGSTGSSGGPSTSSSTDSSSSASTDSPAGGATGFPSGTAPNAPSATAKSSALDFRFTLVRQSLRRILKTKTIHADCYLATPGTCMVRTSVGTGHTTLEIAGEKVVTIKLSDKALGELRDTGKLKLTLTATATAGDHRTATKTVTLVVR